jgi:hypothetical protein
VKSESPLRKIEMLITSRSWAFPRIRKSASPAATSGDAAQDVRVEKREDYHDLRLAPHHHWKKQGQPLQTLQPQNGSRLGGTRSWVS